MTWGKLRFLLQQQPSGGQPAPSLDQIDAWLNSRYEQVLEASDWTGLRARATLRTVEAYQSSTDTVVWTVASATVTGTGTSFSSATVGLRIYRPGDTAYYTVTAVASATSLTLDRPYEGNGTDADGTSFLACPYVLMQDTYRLPADLTGVESVLDAISQYPLTGLTQGEFDEAAGPRTLIADPEVYCVTDDTAEDATGATSPVHQLRFFPPPKRARGYVVAYLRDAFRFNGLNLAQSPLPFVSESVLSNGVRADIAAWQGNLTQAGFFEQKFGIELRRLQLQDASQRKPKETLRVAARLTRHRLERTSRGFSSGWRGGVPGGPD